MKIVIIISIMLVLISSCEDIANADGQFVVVPQERDSTDILYFPPQINIDSKGRNLWEICDLGEKNGTTLYFMNRSNKPVIKIDSFKFSGGNAGFSVDFYSWVPLPIELPRNERASQQSIMINFSYEGLEKGVHRDTLLFLGTDYKMYFKKE
jgi:hypothetical protein